MEIITRNQPDYAAGLSVLGLLDAGLGRKEDAIREGRRAVELLPISKDSINGTSLVENLAIIYAWTGEADLALEKLLLLASIPASVSYGHLRLRPEWDPLRNDPRFANIIASLAPKAGGKRIKTLWHTRLCRETRIERDLANLVSPVRPACARLGQAHKIREDPGEISFDGLMQPDMFSFPR
jgi:hypothetical protein